MEVICALSKTRVSTTIGTLPPPVPYRAITGMAYSASRHSLRVTWLYSFFILHYYCRVVRHSVLVIAGDCGCYSAPPVATGIVHKDNRLMVLHLLPESSGNIITDTYFRPPWSFRTRTSGVLFVPLSADARVGDVSTAYPIPPAIAPAPP